MTNPEKLILTSIKYLGIKESLTGWEPTIKQWILASCKSIGIAEPKDDSEFAWCACFISNMLIEAGIWPADKTHIVAARKFLNVGTSIVSPMPGDLAILERGPGFGHIGIVLSMVNGMWLLSGNSMNAVTVHSFDQKRVLGFRRI